MQPGEEYPEEEQRAADEVISVPLVLIDKARARKALALLSQAPLTPAQKEQIRQQARRILEQKAV